jgi:hypothetical protein
MLDAKKMLAPGVPYSSQDFDIMACQCLDRSLEYDLTGAVKWANFYIARAQVLATLSNAAALREANRD